MNETADTVAHLILSELTTQNSTAYLAQLLFRATPGSAISLNLVDIEIDSDGSIVTVIPIFNELGTVQKIPLTDLIKRIELHGAR